ncbi:hypothetical protein, partial [Agathobacter rectalis]
MILMDFSYFLPGLFRLFGWVWGAVLGISAVSATFSCSFPDFGLGLESSPNLCVNSSSSYISPSMLPLSSRD